MDFGMEFEDEEDRERFLRRYNSNPQMFEKDPTIRTKRMLKHRLLLRQSLMVPLVKKRETLCECEKKELKRHIEMWEKERVLKKELKDPNNENKTKREMKNLRAKVKLHLMRTTRI
eukprot:TRINITY_DN49_c0_g1_i2.p3 TRINITY_DN49_c0_g1~~TRINITY_DN49_c0_g1_i2.p3  ORF type:complete len:116 (-),score=31.19 TRINITY_DN49_c0_g1_i2:163-510(-)